MILKLALAFVIFLLTLFSLHLIEEENLICIATKGRPMRFKNTIQLTLFLILFSVMYLIGRTY